MEIPLCLNDVDSFFISVIIHPFIGWIFTAIIAPLFISLIVVRYTIFKTEKARFITKLTYMLYNGTIEYKEDNEKLFKSKYHYKDILEVISELNSFLLTTKRHTTDMSDLPKISSYMAGNEILKYYYKEGISFNKTWKEEHPNTTSLGTGYLPSNLVYKVQKLVDYCNDKIKPNLWWLILGKKT